MKKNNLYPQMIFLSFTLVFLFLLPLQSFSQDFPSKPITIYVGYEPGASTDVLTRTFATEAERILGVPVVVENKAGGGTSVAAALVASKKPDGYTLAVVSTGGLTAVPIMTRNLSYNPLKDFTFIFSFTEYQYSLCTRNDSPVKTLPELIKHARNNPGALLSYSTPGTGTTNHLNMEYLAKEAKVKFKHVPFKGGIPAYTALLGGHVDMTSGSGTERSFVKQGQFRMLTMFHKEKRDPNFPDVPILKEFGYKDSPGAGAAIILLAPKNLPGSVYNKLESAFTQAVHAPKLQNTLKQIDFPFVFKDRRKLETDLPRHYKSLAEFLGELGLVKK
jgi:tripartite-type tricarboxylate transporter receptor subunit TctC